MAINEDKLHEFGRFVGDLGDGRGRRRGHRAPARPVPGAGRPSPRPLSKLAARTRTDSRYIAEWLRGQAAGGYVEYDVVTDTYSMTEEQAFALANPDGGVYVLVRCVAASSGRCEPSRGSPRRSATAPGSAGTSRTRTCS